MSDFLRIYSRFVPKKFCRGIYGPSPLRGSVRGQSFVIFRLAGVGGSPFLVSIVVAVLFSAVRGGVLSSHSIEKVLVFSRCTRDRSVGSAFSNTSVRSAITFYCRGLHGRGKTINAVIRSLTRLPSGRCAGNVVTGARLLCILPTGRVICSRAMRTFRVGGQDRMGLVGSVHGSFSKMQPCSRVFVQFVSDCTAIMHLRLSPRGLLTFRASNRG